MASHGKRRHHRRRETDGERSHHAPTAEYGTRARLEGGLNRMMMMMMLCFAMLCYALVCFAMLIIFFFVFFLFCLRASDANDRITSSLGRQSPPPMEIAFSLGHSAIRPQLILILIVPLVVRHRLCNTTRLKPAKLIMVASPVSVQPRLLAKLIAFTLLTCPKLFSAGWLLSTARLFSTAKLFTGKLFSWWHLLHCQASQHCQAPPQAFQHCQAS